jgi:transposase
MHAYSQDLRDRVLRALERGERPTAIARRFEVSRMWVHRVRARWQKGGLRCSLPMGGYRRLRLAGLEPVVRSWIAQKADLTLAETCARLAARGVTIRVPALWHQLDQWGLTFKKNPARQRARARRRAAGAPGVASSPPAARPRKAPLH